MAARDTQVGVVRYVGWMQPNPITRDMALKQLATFLNGAGAHYAGQRNTDRGRDAMPTTSSLSPYLRRRVLTEEEVVVAASEAFGAPGAEKFVSEVFWRTYFKGHLETHPEAWTGYLAGVEQQRARLEAEPGLRRIHEQAIEGRTGIDGFDDWARDLVEAGWLHNHTRMWFASIWIFTLRLPWQLGAAFFLQHLRDGDPASNTLSWRWVAGLHTRGKHYLARRDNIRRHTEGRYDPKGLNETAESLTEAVPPREQPIAAADRPPSSDVALLLHLDDLHPESLRLEGGKVARVAGFLAHMPDASESVREADREAMADAIERASRHFGCPGAMVHDEWSADLPIVTAWTPVARRRMRCRRGASALDGNGTRWHGVCPAAASSS